MKQNAKQNEQKTTPEPNVSLVQLWLWLVQVIQHCVLVLLVQLIQHCMLGLLVQLIQHCVFGTVGTTDPTLRVGTSFDNAVTVFDLHPPTHPPQKERNKLKIVMDASVSALSPRGRPRRRATQSWSVSTRRRSSSSYCRTPAPPGTGASSPSKPRLTPRTWRPARNWSTASWRDKVQEGEAGREARQQRDKVVGGWGGGG